MGIVLIGHGKMGRAIYEIAEDYSQKISEVFETSESLENVEPSKNVCIDFTNADAFGKNYKLIADKFDAAVVGTTGWDAIQNEVFDYFTARDKTLIYASNFSLGVNIFFQIVEITSKLLSKFGHYDPYLVEMHHKQKKDAPSGTAQVLYRILRSNFGDVSSPVSVRSGQIKGIHEIGFESSVDKIVVKHEAYSRRGFAEGALLAVELASTTKGVWSFRDLLESKFKEVLR